MSVNINTRRRVSLRRIWSMLFIMALMAVCTASLLALKQAWATEVVEPTLTIVSVSQNEENFEPVWDEYLIQYNAGGFGDYYYPIANNTDTVKIGVRIDGMVEGKTYSLASRQSVTAENNGQVLYVYNRPVAYMGDSAEYNEGEGWTYRPSANEYAIWIGLEDVSEHETITNVRTVLRPKAVGSSNVEIISLKQNGQDVYLDTVGRQVKDEKVQQTINEYQLLDYTKPVTITYKLKNLQAGWNYRGGLAMGENKNFFVADASEKIVTEEAILDASTKHIDAHLSVYGYPDGGLDSGSYDADVTLHFRVMDENFVPLGKTVLDGVVQGGVKVEPTVSDNGYSREYAFQVNDVQDVTINFHMTSADEKLDYWVYPYLSPSHSSPTSYRSPVWIKMSGKDLRDGASITVPAYYGDSDYSPFTFYLSIGVIEGVYYGGQVYYGEYNKDNYSGDTVELNFYESNAIPRYVLAYGYANYPEAPEDAYLGAVSARYHDSSNPLKVRVEGRYYEDDLTYDVKVNVKRGDEAIYARTFTATGAELNANGGKNFVLEGLTLETPEFDPNEEPEGLWSVYGKAYEFEVEINGLKQTAGGVYYVQEGNMNTIVTFSDGSVGASAELGGLGSGQYVSYNESYMNRSAFSGAMINFVGGDFEEDTVYNYTLYYNGNATTYDSAAGIEIASGTMKGKDLNSAKLRTALMVPEDGVRGVWYNLVIKKADSLVLIVRERICVYDGAKLEKFDLSVSDGDYTQGGRNRYVLSKGANMQATMTGVGFDDDAAYQLNVYYQGYNMNEKYGYHEYGSVNLNDLNATVTVSGAELNAGYTYAIPYDERFGSVLGVDVVFDVMDGDGEYTSQTLELNYVEAEEVTNVEGGFFVDENGVVIMVGRGEEPEEPETPAEPDEPAEVPVDDKTGDAAQATIENGVLSVTSKKACMVIGLKNGVHSVVEVGAGENLGESGKRNQYDVGGFEEVKVVLKGDLDMRGTLNARDSARIDYYLLSKDNPNHRELSDLEKLIADVDGNGKITARDSALVDYAILSVDNAGHRDLAW